jgi:hypothetical protein
MFRFPIHIELHPSATEHPHAEIATRAQEPPHQSLSVTATDGFLPRQASGAPTGLLSHLLSSPLARNTNPQQHATVEIGTTRPWPQSPSPFADDVPPAKRPKGNDDVNEYGLPRTPSPVEPPPPFTPPPMPDPPVQEHSQPATAPTSKGPPASSPVQPAAVSELQGPSWQMANIERVSLEEIVAKAQPAVTDTDRVAGGSQYAHASDYWTYVWPDDQARSRLAPTPLRGGTPQIINIVAQCLDHSKYSVTTIRPGADSTLQVENKATHQRFYVYPRVDKWTEQPDPTQLKFIFPTPVRSLPNDAPSILALVARRPDGTLDSIWFRHFQPAGSLA